MKPSWAQVACSSLGWSKGCITGTLSVHKKAAPNCPKEQHWLISEQPFYDRHAPKRCLKCVCYPIYTVTPLYSLWTLLCSFLFKKRKYEDLSFYKLQAALAICCFYLFFYHTSRRTNTFVEAHRLDEHACWLTCFEVLSQMPSVLHIHC